MLTLFVCIPTLAQTRAQGDMDRLFGPATAVNQGVGTTPEIRRALVPGPEHELLARLAGSWTVEGTAGRNMEPVAQVAEVTEMMDGAWFELRLFEDGRLVRLSHLGFDGFRGTYAMWEVGAGFTSPQVRAGESLEDETRLHFWRTYTILRRGDLTPIHERLVITFRTLDKIGWQSFEAIGDEAERTQKDVTFTRSH